MLSFNSSNQELTELFERGVQVCYGRSTVRRLRSVVDCFTVRHRGRGTSPRNPRVRFGRRGFPFPDAATLRRLVPRCLSVRRARFHVRQKFDPDPFAIRLYKELGRRFRTTVAERPNTIALGRISELRMVFFFPVTTDTVANVLIEQRHFYHSAWPPRFFFLFLKISLNFAVVSRTTIDGPLFGFRFSFVSGVTTLLNAIHHTTRYQTSPSPPQWNPSLYAFSSFIAGTRFS